MIKIPRPNKALEKALGYLTQAEADLLASVTMLIADERLCLETKAASGNARAHLLQSFEAGPARSSRSPVRNVAWPFGLPKM